MPKGFGFANEDEFRRTERATKAHENSPRNTVKPHGRQPIIREGGGAALDGVVNEDWTPSQIVDVQVWNEDGYTGRMIHARAPHTDGTDMAGLKCRLVRVKGYSTFKYDIEPRECSPTGTPV